MRGFHVNWTRPFAVRAPGMPYAVEPFELLTTALSALFWRRENGSICMVCDSRAAEYYASLGLDFLWDGGMHPLLDAMPDDINATAFWAAGKLYAVAAMKAPCVMLDTDLICWKNIAALLAGAAAAAYADTLVFNLMASFYTAGASFFIRYWGAGHKERIL